MPATSVFLGNISRTFTQQDVFKICSVYGEIVSVFIITTASGKHQGCAFVNFKTLEEAQACIDGLHEKFTFPNCSRPLQVRLATPKKDNGYEMNDPSKIDPYKVFVGNIPLNLNETQLISLFTRFGGVLSANILRHSSGASKGCGFVQFSSTDCVPQVVKEMNGYHITNEPDSLPLIVRIARRGGSLVHNSHDPRNSEPSNDQNYRFDPYHRNSLPSAVHFNPTTAPSFVPSQFQSNLRFRPQTNNFLVNPSPSSSNPRTNMKAFDEDEEVYSNSARGSDSSRSNSLSLVDRESDVDRNDIGIPTEKMWNQPMQNSMGIPSLGGFENQRSGFESNSCVPAVEEIEHGRQINSYASNTMEGSAPESITSSISGMPPRFQLPVEVMFFPPSTLRIVHPKLYHIDVCDVGKQITTMFGRISGISISPDTGLMVTFFENHDATRAADFISQNSFETMFGELPTIYPTSHDLISEDPQKSPHVNPSITGNGMNNIPQPVDMNRNSMRGLEMGSDHISNLYND